LYVESTPPVEKSTFSEEKRVCLDEPFPKMFKGWQEGGKQSREKKINPGKTPDNSDI